MSLVQELIDSAVLKEFGEAKLNSDVLSEAREVLDTQRSNGTVTMEEAYELEEERVEQRLLLTSSLRLAELDRDSASHTQVDQLLEREQHEKKPHSPTVSEVPTVSPEVAQEEAERLDEQNLSFNSRCLVSVSPLGLPRHILETSLKEALILADAEVDALDVFGEHLAKDCLSSAQRSLSASTRGFEAELLHRSTEASV
eukprot:g33588.t1